MLTIIGKVHTAPCVINYNSMWHKPCNLPICMNTNETSKDEPKKEIRIIRDTDGSILMIEIIKQ
jgi:hypothetical protein